MYYVHLQTSEERVWNSDGLVELHVLDFIED